MFDAYLGFEDLPLRVEVEWRGHKRWIVARLEQWPDSDHAVLVCVFEDDANDGEWLVMNSRPPHYLDAVNELLHRVVIFDTTTRQPTEFYRWKDEGEARIKKVVQRSFRGGGEGKLHDVARIINLDKLPREPKLALWNRESCRWLYGVEHWNWIEFARHSDVPFETSQTWASETLLKLWHQPASEARFSWQWAQWSDEERNQQLAPGCNWAEFRHTMKLVLHTNSRLWQSDTRTLWGILPDAESGELRAILHDYESDLDVMDDLTRAWSSWLIAHFASDWRADWMRQYHCVDNFTSHSHQERALVTIQQPPTAHEQLEAKLQLRDWLQGKATPTEINQLLAI